MALANAGKKSPARAVGPRLRILLNVVLATVALLGANAVYLSSVTAFEWFTQHTYQNYFYQYMFLAHLVLGLLLCIPFLVFGVLHMKAAWHRRNRRAVRIGVVLFVVGVLVLLTGLLLTRVSGFDLKQPVVRSTVYWLHVILPLVTIWLYWLHRLVGPRIKWRIGVTYVAVLGVIAAIMVWLHAEDPRNWNAKGPQSGAKYYEPSLVRTLNGNFISARALMNDEYCKKCHADVHAGWKDSVHRFSSFNNPPYLASVMETREFSMKRDKSVQAARWCAGCHDPVPFLSGAFDDPKFDVVDHPTAHAGITCTVCHAITHVNSNKGNGDYTIEEPLHYPFAYSSNSMLQWINNQLVKAKPEFHKKTFLKPLHKSAEFCSTCHKVHIPYALNNYKEFLRGQNHYDTYLLSGVSGHGARSFYYPPVAKTNCSQCHMPLKESNDFGARLFEDSKQLSIHDHLFPTANTGIAWLRERPDIVAAHRDFLGGVMRVDLFGVRQDGEIDGRLTAPLRPEVPTLVRGKKYLFETVIRTLTMGHVFTQGTGDSNEIWLDVTVKSGDRVIGRSGGLDDGQGKQVDPWSHFVNIFMLDKDGNRIDRRNPQDIFTPLYVHGIPPGAGQTVHYEFAVPRGIDAPITVEVKLQYRKFDQQYMQYVAENSAKVGTPIRGYQDGKPYVNNLPITTLAVDSCTFPVEGVDIEVQPGATPDPRNFPTWQRWNDYGIGLLLKGKAELRQAAEAFKQVEKLDRWDGPMNLARVYNLEGRLDEAVAALARADSFKDREGYPRWTWAWLSGDINRQQGYLEEAVTNLRSVLQDQTAETRRRKFDFSKDYVVINLLGQTLFDLGRQRSRQGRSEEATQHWQDAVSQFQKTLAIDSENVDAHYNLQLLYTQLGDKEKAAEHAASHRRYKTDDNAQGRAVRLARERYPAANHAANSVVKYSLQRGGAPGLKSGGTATATGDAATNSHGNSAPGQSKQGQSKPGQPKPGQSKPLKSKPAAAQVHEEKKK